MSETSIEYKPSTALETPFQMLKRLTDESDELQAELESLNLRIRENEAERIMVATKIFNDKLTDEEFALSPTFKMRESTKVDYFKFRTEFPEIWKRACPYVSDNVAMDILEEANGGDMDAVQEILRGFAPEQFDAKAKVRLDTLRKCISKSEKFQLEEAGVLKSEFNPSGDARIMSKSFVEAVKSQRRPKKIAAVVMEDED